MQQRRRRKERKLLWAAPCHHPSFPLHISKRSLWLLSELVLGHVSYALVPFQPSWHVQVPHHRLCPTAAPSPHAHPSPPAYFELHLVAARPANLPSLLLFEQPGLCNRVFLKVLSSPNHSVVQWCSSPSVPALPQCAITLHLLDVASVFTSLQESTWAVHSCALCAGV